MSQVVEIFQYSMRVWWFPGVPFLSRRWVNQYNKTLLCYYRSHKDCSLWYIWHCITCYVIVITLLKHRQIFQHCANVKVISSLVFFTEYSMIWFDGFLSTVNYFRIALRFYISNHWYFYWRGDDLNSCSLTYICMSIWDVTQKWHKQFCLIYFELLGQYDHKCSA